MNGSGCSPMRTGLSLQFREMQESACTGTWSSSWNEAWTGTDQDRRAAASRVMIPLPGPAIIGTPPATGGFQTRRGSDNVKISVRPAGGRRGADRGGAGYAGAHATAPKGAVCDPQRRGDGRRLHLP